MKTKILSFILFAILLIFTSCGDGTTNSGNSDINDNPQFEKSVLDSITVKTLPTKTQYSVGETLDPTGLVLQGNYIDYFSDGSTQTSKRDIDYNTYKNELAFSPTNLSTEGTIKITVTYNKKSTTFNITVGKSSSDSKYADWFKEVKIGGENSPYKAFIIDNSAYNKENKDFTAESKMNDYLNKYIGYVNGLTLNKELTGGIEIPTTAIKNMAGNNAEWRFDALIGTVSKNEVSANTIGINDVCKPAIEKITKNIGISGNDEYNKDFDKTMFELYYRTIANEVYNYANSGSKTYTDEKNDIQYRLSYANNIAGTDYNIYQEDDTIHPEALQRFDQMITKAADRLNIDVNDLYNIVNLSFTASAIEGTHDQLSESLLVNEHKHTDECCNNEMVDVIENVKVDDMVAKSKLNKSIFSQDFGRELC